jgi:serine-type D-Ala-D-Ala carboxypeptidase/endopeptidase
MKQTTILTLLVVCVLSACSKDAFKPAELSSNPLSTTLDRDIDVIFKKHQSRLNTVGMTIAYAKGTQKGFYGYGETRKGNGEIPSAQTFFEIGSITKTFTATAALLWLNEKGLSLDSPIRPFLPTNVPVLRQNGVEVSFKQVLNHSSGIPYMPDNLNLLFNIDQSFANYSETKLFDFLQKGKLNNTPGSTYEYSNTAMGLMGTILARENKVSYQQYVEEKICKPLGLLATKGTLSALEEQNMCDGHKGGKKVNFWKSLGAMDGAGVLRSSTADLLQYGVACLNPPNTALGKAMLSCQEPTLSKAKWLSKGVQIGLGWHLITPKGVDTPILFHNGGTGGFNTNLFVDKKRDLVLVVFYNSISDEKDEAAARNALNNDLLDLLR